MVNSYQHSIIAQLLEAITGQINFTGTPTSNIGDILLSILEQTPYDKEPKSVLAELFLKLKDKLEGRAFTPYDKEPKSAIAEILLSILNETEYDKEPNSRIAELLLELKAELESYTELTASGAIANFTTSVVKPLVNLTSYFKATQEAGTPTPQSPKAISGVSAVSVIHTKENLTDIRPFSEWVAVRSSYYVLRNCIPNTVINVSLIDKDTSIDLSGISFGFVDSKWTGEEQLTTLDYRWFIQGGTPQNTKKNFSVADASVILTGLIFYPQTEETYNKLMARYDYEFELNTVSEYHAYNGSTTLINLGGTYYGGYVSQDKDGKRELVVTSVKKKLSDYAWLKGDMNTANTGRIWYKDFNSDAEINMTNAALCDSFEFVNNAWDNLGLYQYNARTRNFIFVVEDNYSTSAEMLEDYGNVEFTAILKTPITIPLTDGEPITAFNGVNNIYNDSGDTSVTYLAKIEDNLNATAKHRAEEKAQKEKEKEELKEIITEDPIEEVKEPVVETKKGANKA